MLFFVLLVIYLNDCLFLLLYNKNIICTIIKALLTLGLHDAVRLRIIVHYSMTFPATITLII